MKLEKISNEILNYFLTYFLEFIKLIKKNNVNSLNKYYKTIVLENNLKFFTSVWFWYWLFASFSLLHNA